MRHCAPLSPEKGKGDPVSSSSRAKVRLHDGVACGENVGVTVHADAAGFEDVAVIGKLEGEARVLFDEEDGDAGLVEVADDAEGFEDELGSEAHRGLVEQKD